MRNSAGGLRNSSNIFGEKELFVDTVAKNVIIYLFTKSSA